MVMWRVLVVVAVDQQQTVDRSPHVEGPFPFDPHCMEIEAQRPTPRLIPVSQCESPAPDRGLAGGTRPPP